MSDRLSAGGDSYFRYVFPEILYNIIIRISFLSRSQKSFIADTETNSTVAGSSSEIGFLRPGISNRIVFPEIFVFNRIIISCSQVSFAADAETYSTSAGSSPKICFLRPGVHSRIVFPKIFVVSSDIPKFNSCSQIAFAADAETNGFVASSSPEIRFLRPNVHSRIVLPEILVVVSYNISRSYISFVANTETNSTVASNSLKIGFLRPSIQFRIVFPEIFVIKRSFTNKISSISQISFAANAETNGTGAGSSPEIRFLSPDVNYWIVFPEILVVSCIISHSQISFEADAETNSINTINSLKVDFLGPKVTIINIPITVIINAICNFHRTGINSCYRIIAISVVS